jgi:hypothetical protein
MEYFTVRNTIILALVQVGVTVGGVLGAVTVRKMYTTFRAQPSSATNLVADYGFLVLALPVAWFVLAMLAFRRDTEKDAHGSLGSGAIVLGVFLLALLLMGAWAGAIGPWLYLMNPGFSLG